MRAPAARLLAGLLLAAALAAPAHAVQPDEVLADPKMEARARDLSRELRCMVCQNQSIDDSDAPLARDLRIIVRERLKAGDSDQQVLDFLVARYGEFVLMRPTWHGANVLLWLAPFGVLLAGIAGVLLYARRRGAGPDRQAPLTPDEERRLGRLIDEAGGKAPADLTKL
ncbi:cytochrome c-type biogenesis protein [Bosea sp. 117]|uniref:cytochrome c-type biogenesis protein n=1 Tax=Bosea sp. 117 TaxID=1125973 RepID=UPI0004944181|nr:cytochrome c-type biogenesis protein [Bosea sp. 117]